MNCTLQFVNHLTVPRKLFSNLYPVSLSFKMWHSPIWQPDALRVDLIKPRHQEQLFYLISAFKRNGRTQPSVY